MAGLGYHGVQIGMCNKFVATSIKELGTVLVLHSNLTFIELAIQFGLESGKDRFFSFGLESTLLLLMIKFFGNRSQRCMFHAHHMLE